MLKHSTGQLDSSTEAAILNSTTGITGSVVLCVPTRTETLEMTLMIWEEFFLIKTSDFMTCFSLRIPKA